MELLSNPSKHTMAWSLQSCTVRKQKEYTQRVTSVEFFDTYQIQNFRDAGFEYGVKRNEIGICPNPITRVIFIRLKNDSDPENCIVNGKRLLLGKKVATFELSNQPSDQHHLKSYVQFGSRVSKIFVEWSHNFGRSCMIDFFLPIPKVRIQTPF